MTTDVMRRFTSSDTFTCTTSFSKLGFPRPAGGTSSCVKLNCSWSTRMPRRRSKCICDTFAPKKNRPRPSVWARSPKIGPADVEVFTGRPPTNWNVTPLDAEVIGVFATLAPIELPMKLRMLAPLAVSAGMKCSPWPMRAPWRHRGSPHVPNVNSSFEIRVRRS